MAMAVASVAAPRAVRAQNPAQPAAVENPSPTTAESPAAFAYGTTVADLNTLLTAPTTGSSDRLEAARRLVARQSTEARTALNSVVSSSTNAPARIAALRALADDPNPDPGLLATLATAVQSDTDERVVSAAAAALGAYKNNPQALGALSQAALATARPQPLRAAAMRGLALLVDQAAAATLVGIATNPRETSSIVADATDALVELTGIEANGRDPAKWSAWQAQFGGLAPSEWKAAVVDTRAARDQRVRRHLDELVDELQPMFEEQYASTPPAQMPERLLKFLGGTTPEVRRIGARIANKASNNAFPNGRPTPAVQVRLEDMVGDADAGVRLEALLALENLIVGDRSLLAIRQQLPLETDNRVKAAMARTLSKIPDLTAVPDLNRLLDDASPVVVREAADAIRRRASVIAAKDAKLRDATALKLQATMTRIQKQPAFGDAVRMCGEALAALKDPTNQKFATEVLLRSPQPDMRAAGLTVLGELGPRMADLIINAIQAEQGQSPAAIRVRKAGMEALAKAGNFARSAEYLRNQLNPRIEPSLDVRTAASNAYLSLARGDGVDRDTLLSEISRLGDAEMSMRVEVRKALVDKFKAAKKEEDAVVQQISIADEYTKLGRPADAVTSRQEAINHYLKRGILDDQLVRRQAESMLQTQQYARLAALAQTLFSQPNEEDRKRFQSAIGPRIKNEVIRLIEEPQDDPRKKQTDWDNAAKLIATFSNMDPPLANTYLEDLRKASSKLETQRRLAPTPQPGGR